MATKKYESMKALDEMFVYGYKLRRAGLDEGIVHNIVGAIMVGAPMIAFTVENEELSEYQQNVIDILNNNGFKAIYSEKMIVIKDLHFSKLKEDIDAYFKSKEETK